MSFDTANLTYPLIILLSFSVAYFMLKKNWAFSDRMRSTYIILLFLQLLSGFGGFERFIAEGESGFSIATSQPQTLLGLYFILVVSQLILLKVRKTEGTRLAAPLSFANTIVFFVAMMRYSSFTGTQVVSLASLTAIFSNLFANIAVSLSLYEP